MFAVTIAARNHDRARSVLPVLLNYCKAVIQASERPSRACEVVVFELLGACSSMMASFAGRRRRRRQFADEMMGALRLLFALEPACADAYFGGIAHELDALIETSAERIASPASWDVLCKLLSAKPC